MSKCKQLFLILGTSKTDNFALFCEDFDRPDRTGPDITFYSNQQLSKNVPTPYEIATYSYDPYTKLNDKL